MSGRIKLTNLIKKSNLSSYSFWNTPLIFVSSIFPSYTRKLKAVIIDRYIEINKINAIRSTVSFVAALAARAAGRIAIDRNYATR